MNNSEHRLMLETRAAKALKAVLCEVTGDPDALADTIEGATNLHEAIARVMAGIMEDEMMVTGLGVMAETLDKRCERYEARIMRRRSAIERAMAAGELSKLELPEATLSLRKVPPKVEVYDETRIPAQFFDPQPAKLNKERLKVALLNFSDDVPGARFSNGGQSLSIRRS